VASTSTSKPHLPPRPNKNSADGEGSETKLDGSEAFRSSFSSIGATGKLPTASFKGIQTFKAAANGILAVVKLGLLSDEGVPFTKDEVALVQRIALTVASTETFKVLSERVFQRYCIVASNDVTQEAMIPVEQLSKVLDHWDIPQDHFPMLQALIRRLPSHWDFKFPSLIGAFAICIPAMQCRRKDL